jgi:hypothetical protein
MDCIDFVSAATPAGPLELAPALAEHLKRLRRPGKAILLSDFLMPVASYQQGLNLLRAFNLDITVIQVLAGQELNPPFPRAGLALVDSESRAELQIQWSGELQRRYQERLERHNRELKSFCHQSGIHYSLFVSDGELSEFVLETLPTIGLFK